MKRWKAQRHRHGKLFRNIVATSCYQAALVPHTFSYTEWTCLSLVDRILGKKKPKPTQYCLPFIVSTKAGTRVTSVLHRMLKDDQVSEGRAVLFQLASLSVLCFWRAYKLEKGGLIVREDYFTCCCSDLRNSVWLQLPLKIWRSGGTELFGGTLTNCVPLYFSIDW